MITYKLPMNDLLVAYEFPIHCLFHLREVREMVERGLFFIA